MPFPHLRHHLRCELPLGTTQNRRDRRANGDVVATDHRGELVRVGGAAQEPQESDVVHLGQLFVLEAQAFPEGDGDQAGAQRLLEGLAHPQVRGQRQGGHQLGQAELFSHAYAWRASPTIPSSALRRRMTSSTSSTRLGSLPRQRITSSLVSKFGYEPTETSGNFSSSSRISG